MADSGNQRSRLTTVFGMLPLVLRHGSGSELYRGLGAVMVGGLLVSTVFTLLLVPTLFSLVLDARAAIVGIAQRRARPAIAAPSRGMISTNQKRQT